MSKPKIFLFLFCLVFLLVFPSVFAQETITITTYYPSPYGSYSSLQADKLGVGDNNADGSLTTADVPTTTGNVWIKGNVGIGTTNPLSTLDIRSAFNADVHWGQADFISTDSVAANKGGKITFGGSYTGTTGTIWAGISGFKENATDGQYGGYLGLWTRTNGASMAERVRIDSSGNVGIGTTGPTYQLQLSTDSAAKPTSNTWTIASDRKLKKNIKPLKGALDKMLKLRGVTYQWKEPQKFGNMHGTYMGLVGQEVENVFPEWVGTNHEGYKDLTVTGFEALTAEAIRELKAENDALKARIEALEKKL